MHAALVYPYRGYQRRNHEKAAAVLHGIVVDHGFAHGNKRTVLLLTELWLRRSSYRLDANDPADLNLIVGVADHTVAYDELVVWLQARVVRSPSAVTAAARTKR